MPVLDAMGLVCGRTQAGLSVGFILGIIPVKPDDLAVTLEGQHVCGDAVEKPSVVAYDHGATGEAL